MITKQITVTKRDGVIGDFNIQCISKAIFKSFAATNELNTDEAQTISVLLAKKVEDRLALTNKTNYKIDEIQSCVELELAKGFPVTAIAYIEYRHERDRAREKETSFYKDIVGLTQETADDICNENANKDAKLFSTKRDLLAGIISKEFARMHLLPAHIVRAHDTSVMHYHDLDYSPFMRGMFNCMLVDVRGMLKDGFTMGDADIEPPKSIATAAAVTAQIICQVSNHIYGGVTVHAIDSALAPYVKMSYNTHKKNGIEDGVRDPKAYALKHTRKECYDAFQTLEYSINCINTCQGQSPFTTLGISGFDTSLEARMITESIFNVRMKGLGKDGKTAIFPKLVYTIRKGYNFKKGDPNYDMKQLALRCAAKRMYPDITNYDKLVEITGSFKTPMGCRSFLNVHHDEHGNEVHDGRNNLGVISLNLPRIALETNTEEEFFSLLDERLVLCREALMTRIDSFRGVKASSSPILYMNGACGIRLKADDEIMPLFENGRASISLGYIGLHETVNGIYGNDTHIFDDADKKDLSVRILNRLREATDTWKKETNFAFGLYSTPSESLCYRFLKADRAEFGHVAGVTDKDYYTNSFHLCVRKQVNPYEKIMFEEVYPHIANGGFINYVEAPNMSRNIEALENIWDFSYDRVPYYGTNQPIDECYECGFEGEFTTTSKGYTCPSCGNHNPQKMSVTRRVC
ncbi:anaerobic ribonucleoside-triphosphate reductase, partial [Vibrio splendidus]